MMRLLACSLLLLWLSCGGANKADTSQPPDPDPQSTEPSDPEEARQKRNAEKLAEAQRVGCDGMCPRLTECALEEAKAQMTPKEVKELEEVAPRHTEECSSECLGSSLSVKQVETLHRCLREDSGCEPFAECLQALNSDKNDG